MSDRLSKDKVERMAALAHLELTSAETDLFAKQLASILEYFEQIRGLDTEGVEPTSHVLARHPADRPDEPVASLPRDEALANAPDALLEAGLFRVPRVIG
jgi:aspartyl-tRNA(Asn)/glutamyl-tRNA(Gln) amidotransferase subunit C